MLYQLPSHLLGRAGGQWDDSQGALWRSSTGGPRRESHNSGGDRVQEVLVGEEKEEEEQEAMAMGEADRLSQRAGRVYGCLQPLHPS